MLHRLSIVVYSLFFPIIAMAVNCHYLLESSPIQRIEINTSLENFSMVVPVSALPRSERRRTTRTNENLPSEERMNYSAKFFADITVSTDYQGRRLARFSNLRLQISPNNLSWQLRLNPLGIYTNRTRSIPIVISKSRNRSIQFLDYVFSNLDFSESKITFGAAVDNNKAFAERTVSTTKPKEVAVSQRQANGGVFYILTERSDYRRAFGVGADLLTPATDMIFPVQWVEVYLAN